MGPRSPKQAESSCKPAQHNMGMECFMQYSLFSVVALHLEALSACNFPVPINMQRHWMAQETTTLDP